MLYIIFATLIVVVLFQIIILINQQKNGKLVGDFIAQRNKSFQDRGGDRPDRFRDRNNNGNRQNRPPRTEQEVKPRTPQAQAPTPSVAPDGVVDNMEKSLRDINLKLKNAERDQEAARRKFQDNDAVGGNRDRDRDQSRRRPHHDRDGNRESRDGGNRGGRDENRDHRRGGGDRDRNNRSNWRDRNQDRPFQEERSAESSDAEVRETSLPVMQADVGAITAPAAPSSVPEMSASDFDSDNTEHGRKIMVKRRQLKDDQPGENSSSNEGSSSDASAAGSNAADTSSEKPAGDAEISFGRR